MSVVVGKNHIDAERKKHGAAQKLHYELVVFVLDKIRHKTHAKSRDESINDVAESGTYASQDAVFEPLVKHPLNTKNSYRTTGRRANDANCFFFFE